jgi:membrane fusion protein (multidrug efflux system)
MGCGVADYGEMLLGVAAWPRRRRTRASSAVITAFESRRTLERRLLAMKHFSLWSRPTSRSMVVVLTLVVLTALVPWRVVAQQRAATAGNAGAADPAAPPAPEGAKPAIAGETVSVLGVLTSATAEIKCPADTVVREVQIKEGARVKKGDVIFQLDSRRARDAMVEAEAQLKAAEIKYKRVKTLRATAAISESEIDEAEGALEIARNALESRRHDMDDTRIPAPFDAIVERLSVRPGQGVSRNTVLCELLEAGVPALEMSVPEKDYPRLKVGNRIDATTSLLSERHFAGEVTFVAARIDAGSGTIRVKATVADPKEQLKPGMQMQVKLELAE